MINVFFNDFKMNSALPIWDGHTFFCDEQTKRLYNYQRKRNIFCHPHLFEKYVSSWSSTKYDFSSGVVYSNAGPYGYTYHLQRELLNGNWPIIREVGTGFWIGYFFQEWLCTPLTRTYDKIIFPSSFAINLYNTAFSYHSNNLIRCYPFVDTLKTYSRMYKRQKGRIKLGYIGRISKDKNLIDLFEGFSFFCNNTKHNNTELHIVGSEYDLSINRLKEILKKNRISESKFKYYGGKVSPKTIYNFYKTIDFFIFLSTSNVESLGRVVIECAMMGIPVLMIDYGSGREFFEVNDLISPNFHKNWFNSYDLLPLGEIKPELISKGLEKLVNKPTLPNIERIREDHNKFLTLLNSDTFNMNFSEKGSGLFLRFKQKGMPVLSRDQAIEYSLLAVKTLKQNMNIANSFRSIENSKKLYQDLSYLPKVVAREMGFNPEFIIRNEQNENTL